MRPSQEDGSWLCSVKWQTGSGAGTPSLWEALIGRERAHLQSCSQLFTHQAADPTAEPALRKRLSSSGPVSACGQNRAGQGGRVSDWVLADLGTQD